MPADLRQPVFRDELDAFARRFETAIERASERTTAAIEKSESAWRERLHELASNLHAQQVAAALLAQRVAAVEKAAEAEKDERRALWGRMLAAAGVIAGIATWIADKVQGAVGSR